MTSHWPATPSRCTWVMWGEMVRIMLMGSKTTSGKTPEQGGSFDQGSVVTTQSEYVDFRCLRIKHDNDGFGQDWFLDFYSADNGYQGHRETMQSRWCVWPPLWSPHPTPHPHPKLFYKKDLPCWVCMQQGNKGARAGTHANMYLTLYTRKGSGWERRVDSHRPAKEGNVCCTCLWYADSIWCSHFSVFEKLIAKRHYWATRKIYGWCFCCFFF